MMWWSYKFTSLLVSFLQNASVGSIVHSSESDDPEVLGGSKVSPDDSEVSSEDSELSSDDSDCSSRKKIMTLSFQILMISKWRNNYKISRYLNRCTIDQQHLFFEIFNI